MAALRLRSSLVFRKLPLGFIFALLPVVLVILRLGSRIVEVDVLLGNELLEFANLF